MGSSGWPRPALKASSCIGGRPHGLVQHWWPRGHILDGLIIILVDYHHAYYHLSLMIISMMIINSDDNGAIQDVAANAGRGRQCWTRPSRMRPRGRQCWKNGDD